jgi:hypothetical protein
MTTTDAFLGGVIKQPVLASKLSPGTERRY